MLLIKYLSLIFTAIYDKTFKKYLYSKTGVNYLTPILFCSIICGVMFKINK